MLVLKHFCIFYRDLSNHNSLKKKLNKNICTNCCYLIWYLKGCFSMLLISNNIDMATLENQTCLVLFMHNFPVY